MAFKTKAEKNAYKRGLFAGLFGKNKKSNKSVSKKAAKSKTDSKLLELHKRYRERNLGALLYKGKIYDTNFKDGPHEIDRETLKKLHEEYDMSGTRTDIEVADSYVYHMRRKFGVFDGKTGKWLGLLGDK